jgi:predicted aspartyl protease
MVPVAQRPSALSRRAFVASLGGGLLGACAGAPRAGAGTASAPLVYDDRGTLTIAARVAGGPLRRFVLDTGASRSALSMECARELGLLLRSGGEVEGTAGTVQVAAATAALEVPGLASLALDFTVQELAGPDPDCVGILGAEFLCLQPFTLRYRARVLLWRAPPPSGTVPLHLDRGIPCVDVRIGGVSVSLRLDTGAALPPGDDAYLNVTAAQADELGLRGKPAAVFTAGGIGAAKLELPVHRIADVVVAGRGLPRAFAIVQPRVGYFARPDAVGFLGNAVLDKLDPFLDYAAGRFGVTA